MRIFALIALVVACAAAQSESGGGKCGKWMEKWKLCIDAGYVQRKCNDDKTQSEKTPEHKKLKCKKIEKRLTKNCAMKCPPPPPEPEEPDSCWDDMQKDYRGEIAVTVSGFECMNWREQSPHSHSRTEANYPNTGLGDHNYCRNPDNEPGGAWCYSTNPDQRWDYCPVPKCSTPKLQCFDGLQKEYRGPIQVTESGLKCQKWTAQTPHAHSRTAANYPDTGLGDHNYCRNPDDEEGGAWCYTTNPFQRWDYCRVPRCEDSEQYCWDGLQKSYRGPKQTTRKGVQCQKWTSQSPHKHSRTAANYPDEGLGDHNYCRNPDNEAGGSWCYTMDPGVRWDYCDVRTCEGEADTSGAGEPEPCWDDMQKDYRGEIAVTVSGFECMNWREQSPHSHSRTEANYPNTGLGDHNFCRNPDNEPGGTWCYTTNPDQRWDYCPVPKCSDPEVDCYDGMQKDYRGPLQVSKSGKKCQKWTVQSPQAHTRTPANYPDTGLGDHNYCRNPDNADQAWCYTTDPGTRWEYCNVRKCE